MAFERRGKPKDVMFHSQINKTPMITSSPKK
jgi:hypothetical protein